MRKRIKRFQVKVFTKMKDPFSLAFSGGQRSFKINGNLSKGEAIRTMKNMKMIYPNHYKYRIIRAKKRKRKGLKGLNSFALFLGLAVFVFCLALANSTTDLFSLSSSVEDMISLGFMVLGLGSLFVGVTKGIED